MNRLPGEGGRSRLRRNVTRLPHRWCSSAVLAFLVLGGTSAAWAQSEPSSPGPAPVPAAGKGSEASKGESPKAPSGDAQPAGKTPAADGKTPGAEGETPGDGPQTPDPSDEPPEGGGSSADGISDEDLDWDDDDDDGPSVAPPPEPTLTPEEKRELRRARSAQAALEAAEPRPALDELIEPEPPPWAPRLEVGGAFAFVLRPWANAVAPDTGVQYKPAPGWGVVLRWTIYDWIAIHPYFIDSHHRIGIPAGALATDADGSIAPDAVIETNTVTTFSFGAKLAPTWEIIPRLRVWAAIGIGWGRFEFPTMTLTEGDNSFAVEDREGVFVEFPMGLGISYDVIDKWLAVGYEATAAPITDQSGSAHEPFQAVDADGNTRDVGPLGAIEASIVQTLSVTVIL